MIPKYRAWDKEQKCWIKIAALNFDEDGEMWYLAPAMDGFNPVYYENELGKTWELMQSTGLKDQNGREIFDGDFLTDGEERWIVRYSETECGFTASGVGKSGCWSLYHLANGKKKGRLIEVIGNKYENPELLKFR